MGDADQQNVLLAAQFQQQITDGISSGSVEVSGWLVSEQDLWLVNECSADSDALTFSARKLSRTVCHSVG